MRITEISESREPCAEAGWYAYDIGLEQAVKEAQIRALGEHGDLVYLSRLKTPFYKLCQPYFYIQGLQGQNYLRLAVFREEEKRVLAQVENWIRAW